MLKYHLYKLGKVEGQSFRLCLEDLRTREHIFCECVATNRNQHQHFSRSFLTTTKIEGEKSSFILGSIKSLQLI